MAPPGRKMVFPIMWVSWRNAKTELSIPSRETQEMLVASGSILWDTMRSWVMVFLPIKIRQKKNRGDIASALFFCLT